MVTPTKATAAPIKAPPFSIQSTTTKQRYLKLLIYGDFGVGKTFLAGTASDVNSMRDVLILSAESGDQTLDVDGDDDKHRFSDIDVIDIKDYSTTGKVFDYLKLHCQLREDGDIERMAANESRLKGKEIKPGKHKEYHTVIIDSLSEFDQYCLNQLLGITDETRLDDEASTAEWAEYKKNSGMMRRFVRNFRDLPMNVIFICGRNYVQDEMKRFNFLPSMTGKLSSHVQGFMDVVGYLVTDKVTEDGAEIPRKLYVQPVGKFAAKCRFTRFKGTNFENPTMTTILKSVGLLEA